MKRKRRKQKERKGKKRKEKKREERKRKKKKREREEERKREKEKRMVGIPNNAQRPQELRRVPFTTALHWSSGCPHCYSRGARTTTVEMPPPEFGIHQSSPTTTVGMPAHAYEGDLAKSVFFYVGRSRSKRKRPSASWPTGSQVEKVPASAWTKAQEEFGRPDRRAHGCWFREVTMGT